MYNHQPPASYSRPTQQAIEPSGCSLLVVIFLLCFLCLYVVSLRDVLFLPIAIVLGITTGNKIIALCFSAVFYSPLFFLPFLAWKGLENFWLGRKLDAVGLTTSGIIVELWEEQKKHHKHISTIYHFAYQFTVLGNTFGACQHIGINQYTTLHIGDTVTVRYLPTDPTKSRVEW